MPIKYVTGDATEPVVDDGLRVIVHVCNDIGKWGAGFTRALSDKWKSPGEYYKRQFKYAKVKPKLGDVQWQFPDINLAVVNMIAMKGVKHFGRTNAPIRYDALEQCLEKAKEGAVAAAFGDPTRKPQRLTFHMPRIGAGLAGGDWEKIECLLDEVFWDIEAYVYDLET